MSRDVESVVQRCSTCALHAPAPPRERMMPHHIPDLPWAEFIELPFYAEGPCRLTGTDFNRKKAKYASTYS
ncbi:Uncharacterized protein OBRU01_23355, partial [Operophtera brumata]